MSNPEGATDLLTWITLSRVADGNVTTRGDHYLDGDEPLPPYLVTPITTLLTDGLLTIAEADPAGWHPVVLTETGQTRHEQLRHRGAREVDIS